MGNIKDLVIQIAEKVSDAYLEEYGAFELNKFNAVDKDHLDQVAKRTLNHDELELYDNAITYVMEQIKDILEVDEVIRDLKGWGERFEGPAFSRDHDLDVNLDLGEHPMPIDEKYLVPRVNEDTEMSPKTNQIINNLVRQSIYHIEKEKTQLKDIDDFWRQILKPHQFELYMRNRDIIHERISDKLSKEIEWPEEVRNYPHSEEYDEDDDVPYPGGLSQDDYDDYDELDEKFLVPKVNEAYGRKRWSIAQVEKELLDPLAQKLGVTLHKGNRKKQDTYAQKVTSQFYHIGDVPIMVRDVKVAGMGVDDVDVWILDKAKPSTGIKLNPMINYDGIEQKVKDQLSDSVTKTSEEKTDDPADIQKRLSIFIQGAEGNISTDEAFDLASDFLEDDQPAEDYLQQRYPDPVGWLANQI